VLWFNNLKRIKMKQYGAFYWSMYYPAGGMGDLIGFYDTIPEAIVAVNKQHTIENPNDIDWHKACGSVWCFNKKMEVWEN
jgi:hypothetical protein